MLQSYYIGTQVYDNFINSFRVENIKQPYEGQNSHYVHNLEYCK